MQHSNVKYARLGGAEDEMAPNEEENAPPKEPTFQFKSAFSYEDTPDIHRGDGQQHDYSSAFKYRDAHVKIRMTPGTEEGELAAMTSKPQPALVLVSWFLTIMSYLFFVLTLPVSYWFLVKKLGEFDRIVVFRLGKMLGVKGPGRFLIFPWMDRTKRIDVRAAAFAVPPQQFITADGGIVEMGAEIQYGIVDVVTMVSEVADHQDILRSLGKTLLVKILVKKCVHQLERDKRTSESEITDEINDQVRKWGINVHSVQLSETKVLKQPESGSNAAVGSILKGLGMKDDPKYPTPQEFVRQTHGFAEQPTASLLSGTPAYQVQGTPSVNMSLLQSMSSNGGKLPQLAAGAPGIIREPTQTPLEELPNNWGRCLDIIINADPASVIEEDAHGLFKLEITDTEAGREVYFIEITATKKAVGKENTTGREPDVSVSISSPDLANVLDGSLAPLQAYLTGRITANGDVRKLMFFDKLSRRGHKTGSMFNV